ncbi:MAG: hypothetical protein R3181_08980 [Rubricoccaceae bacterium]|nr:hypothetical protein [Rubricoccaceae bacterium]
MPSKTPSILIGAAVYVAIALLISFLQLTGVVGGLLGCLVIFTAGLVAVWHYTSTHHLTIKAGEGAGMGALAGLLGAVVGGAISFALISAGILPDPIELTRQQMVNQGLSDAEMEQALAMAETFSSPIIGLAIGSVLGALFGAASGALGAALFKKGDATADLEGY